ncbi:CsbD family protein [Sinirhodobacter ferrireducens]|uniref:CsbD family protein n=1 Tax=Paenirhodobacter ferrireducens TaxID=1215032 RepID=A0A443LRP7_9RHOB|nr:CsbD family protein [Sinirhodobacter ferrireducens]RWR51847.1 CsbD family protein [Sinirhodobacter ferrireducens]
MNTDMLEGKWKEIKGSVRAKWGELTDDEVEQVAGNTERLAGLIQQKYGRSKEEAKREVNDFIESL